MSVSQAAPEHVAAGVPAPPPHTLLEGAVGVVTGAFLAPLGLFVLAFGGVEADRRSIRRGARMLAAAYR